MPRSREENFKRKNVFSIKAYLATPLQKNSCPRGHKITILVYPSLVIITTYFRHYHFILRLSDLHLRVERCYMCIPNLVKIEPVVLEKKISMLHTTYNARGQTPTHLSLSNDLKNYYTFCSALFQHLFVFLYNNTMEEGDATPPPSQLPPPPTIVKLF